MKRIGRSWCHRSSHSRCRPFPANYIVSCFRVIISSHVPIRKHLSCIELSSHDVVALRKRLNVNIFLFFFGFAVFGTGLPTGCQRLLSVHQLPGRPVALQFKCTVNLLHCVMKQICSLASDTVACVARFLLKECFNSGT